MNDITNKPFEDITHSAFKHIYVEKEILDNDRAQSIIAHFPDSKVIVIDHYKDVFNRKRQDFRVQSKSRSLILAKNTGNLIFEGRKCAQGSSMRILTSTPKGK